MNKDVKIAAKPTPTMRDLAKVTGLSLGTVSQALNNKSGVSPETRIKVLQAANDIGYKLRMRATSDGKLGAIGLLMRQDVRLPISANSFYTVVLGGAERECQRQGINLLYASLEVDEQNRILRFPPNMLEQTIDGYLLVGAFLNEMASELKSLTQRNIVLVDAYAPDQMFDSIVTDNINGAYNAVRYLIEQGHRHIGLVGSMPDAHPSVRERRKGYTRALKEFGIDDQYIEDSPLNYDGGYQGTMNLLKRAPQITAVFACNDNVAGAVMNAAYDLGLSIPDELSVVGFDDIDLAENLVPPLTTVHVNKTLMGEMAVRMLRNRFEHHTETTMTTTLSTRLVVRRSVRALK